jgi:hypothetical protein
MKKDEIEIWKVIGKVGVDSGTLIIGDPCYFFDNEWTEKDFEAELLDSDDEYINIPFKTGYPHKAVLFHTPSGDGTYDVEAKIRDGKIKEMRIVF